VKFVVARNPDADSRLRYLVRLPIDGGLVLKVRDTWPRTSRVFCARVDGDWPPDAELVEEVPVTLCRRRGVAIDLVLDRPRENRSQFIFTILPSGREGIFWQTRKVVTTARPGARIPGGGRAASSSRLGRSPRNGRSGTWVPLWPSTTTRRQHRSDAPPKGRRSTPAATDGLASA